MTLQWYPIAEAVRRVFSGEIVNALAVAGILAAHAAREGFATPRPVDTPWVDKSTAFAARQANT
jgi:ADP-ribose pyrophosphatase